MQLSVIFILSLLHGLSSTGSYLLFGNKDEAFFYTTASSTYTPTPIPLSDVIPKPREMPLLEVTTPIMKRMGNFSEKFEPQNHAQIPFHPPETLDTQPSVSKSVFVPSELENGFKRMVGQPNDNYYDYYDHVDITNTRYDDGSAYFNEPSERRSSYHPRSYNKQKHGYIPHYRSKYTSKQPYSYPKKSYAQKDKNLSSPKPRFASTPITGERGNSYRENYKQEYR